MSTIILYNGPIYTLDPAQPRVQALAIRNGRVLAAGSEGKVQAATGGRAEGINLQGRAVVPALTDAHVHFTWYGITRRQVQLDGVADVETALELIAARAAELPPGAWLIGSGWNHSLWGGQWPTAAMLDRVVPDRPVFLTRKDGHSAWVNSRTLELAQIDDQTPDPPGGTIQREKKKATGILLETALDLVRKILPEETQEERLSALQAAITEAHSYGMAGVHIPPTLHPGDGAHTLTDLQLLRERGQLRLRCLSHIGLDNFEDALRMGIRSGLGDRWLRIGALKLFADGSLGSETAEMLSHYEGRRHLGSQTIGTEELNDLVLQANRSGIAVIIHAIGDAANRRVLDAIERAQRMLSETDPNALEVESKPPKLALPNRIEHCQVLHPRDIPRFAQLGVVASMQPIHATSDMEMADRLWGERAALSYAWRALKESGAVLAFGSDAPVEPLNPWLSVHAAVTRQRIDGTPPGGWYPEQCISVTDALRGFTVGAAVAAGTAHEQGTLMPGMLADLAVLSDDPFTINPTGLHSVRSELTMIEGEIVWER